MPLTPIRVRGKRNFPAVAKTKKRAMKDDAPSSKRRQLRPPKKSLMEREIPLEIMELIFHYSENVNFPRASPLLGRLLSGRQTLVATIIGAFSPTWDVTFGLSGGLIYPLGHPVAKAPAPPILPNKFPLGDIPGNTDFQSAVLACGWATIEFILEAQELWALQSSRRRVSSLEAKGRVHPDDSQPDDPRKGGPGQFHAYACFASDFDRTDSLPSRMPNDAQRNQPSYLDVRPNVRIPDSLVTGPWDEEMVRRLVWLRRGGALLHESQTWELKLIGLHNALPEDKPPPPFLSQLIFWLFLQDDFFWGFKFHDYEKNFIVSFDLFPSWPKEVLVSLHARIRSWNQPKYLSKPTLERIKNLLQCIEYAEERVLKRRAPGLAL